MDSEDELWVRVQLYDDVLSCILQTEKPFYLSEGLNKVSTSQFAGGKEVYTVRAEEGKFVVSGKKFSVDELVIRTDAPYVLTINGADYRGKLRLVLNSNGQTFDVINILPIEAYLLGVVGAEMPDYWEPEALKAQAIAARTYCLYIKNRFGGQRDWDVKRTAANQVYNGLRAESSVIWEVVTETEGSVLVSSESGQIIPAYYSSVCGGHTEDSVNVFGQEQEAIQGVPCPYCKNIVKSSIYFWPSITFESKTVSEKLLNRYPSLEKLGEITNIVSVKPSKYDGFIRPTYLKLIGSTGKSDTVRAEDLRLTIDPTGLLIKSTTFDLVKKDDEWAFIKGRGFGHSVGMCQSGTQGMAREGKTAEEILMYYYPDSIIKKIYTD
ncbi:MAG: SpoIID/LytB domain-containing protein [Planctomycetota bacterium]|jgi:stage II sporulation protein D